MNFAQVSLARHCVSWRLVAKYLKKTINATVTIILTAVVVALLASGVPGFFGLGTVRVMGGSMGNAIPIGSIAVVKPIDVQNVKVGDVVLFGGPGAMVPVMHRITALDRRRNGETLAVTKGDANATPDPAPHPLPKHGGKVIWSVPLAGFALTALRFKLVWVLMILCMIARVVSDNNRLAVDRK